MKRVLAFFGAFNPPTIAHLTLAQYAMEQTGREGVVFVPSQSAYIKDTQGKDFAYSEAERLLMLRELAKNRAWMKVHDGEIRAERQPRTYETLRDLQRIGYEPTLLFGSDKLWELETGWLSVEEICREFGIVCMTRGEDTCRERIQEDPYLRSLAPWILLVETPPEYRQVSSTKARAVILKLRELRKELGQMVPGDILPLLDPACTEDFISDYRENIERKNSHEA